MSSYENGTRTRLGRIWNNMKKRCNNERHESYKYYGAKGIKVCEEWANNFDSFKHWAENNGYEESLTIDRIDNSKDYCPENCRWATVKEQGYNRSTNHLISFNGEELTLTQWAEKLGMDFRTLYRRIHTGWPVEKALTEPVDTRYSRKVDVDND